MQHYLSVKRREYRKHTVQQVGRWRKPGVVLRPLITGSIPVLLTNREFRSWLYGRALEARVRGFESHLPDNMVIVEELVKLT